MSAPRPSLRPSCVGVTTLLPALILASGQQKEEKRKEKASPVQVNPFISRTEAWCSAWSTWAGTDGVLGGNEVFVMNDTAA